MIALKLQIFNEEDAIKIDYLKECDESNVCNEPVTLKTVKCYLCGVFSVDSYILIGEIRSPSNSFKFTFA